MNWGNSGSGTRSGGSRMVLTVPQSSRTSMTSSSGRYVRVRVSEGEGL